MSGSASSAERVRRAAAAMLLAAPVAAPAADAADPLSALAIGKVLLALVVVLALLAGLAALARRAPALGARRAGALQVVDTLALGTRERLVLVAVGHERVLLGVAGGRLERLHSFRAPPEPVAAQPPAYLAEQRPS